jgi:hypothetical protein
MVYNTSTINETKEVIKMNKFSVFVQYVTITTDCVVLAVEKVPIVVYAEDRNGAIRKACDVGQAIARSANGTKFNIFFRIIDIEEIGA